MAIELTLTLLALGASSSAALWARSAVKEGQKLRKDMLGALDALRAEVSSRPTAGEIEAQRAQPPPPAQLSPPEAAQPPPPAPGDLPEGLLAPYLKEEIDRTARRLDSTPLTVLRAAVAVAMSQALEDEEETGGPISGVFYGLTMPKDEEGRFEEELSQMMRDDGQGLRAP